MGSISHRGHIPFVGRRDDLRRLALHRSYLEGNRERGRHLVVVEGFSGVGKTALVQEFLSSLEQDGRSFTPRGAYSPYLRRPILAPLLDALDSLFVGGFAQRNLRSIFTDATYYPLLERLPLLSSAIGYEPHDRSGGSAEPTMLAALIASALAHAAHFRPVVLLLDDIQWMPQEDLETMPALNSGLHNAPVLILATMRRDGGEPAPLRDALRKLSLDDLYLPPLAPPDIAALVTEMYGAQVSSQIAADIAHVSEGVPMRAVEILRTLIDRGVLIDGRGGNWRVSPGYHRRMLAEEGGMAERVRRLDRDEVRTLLLLNCASGVARRDELANWFAMLPPGAADGGTDASNEIHASDEISASNGKDLVARLEHYGLLKPVFADPDQVTFIHDSISEAERELRSEVDLADVAGMIVMSAELRENIDRWTYDTDLFRLILRALPTGDSAERREVLAHFTTPIPMYKILDQLQHWIEVHEAILAERALLAPRELARILVIASSLDFFSEDRLAAAVEKAEEFYRLASSEPSCADLLAESCASLGIARFFRDRTTDVSDLLKEAAGAIDRISDPRERMVAEMQILKLRVTIVPVNRLQEGVAYARRFCHLAEQLGMHEERYSMLGTLAIHTARIRDDEQLRLFCADLLRDLRSGTGAKSQLSNTVINTVRAAIAIGDVFLAREIFEAFSSRLAPLGAGEYVRHCYLTALFALVDGRPSIAADAALSGRKEFLEYSASTSSPFWNISFIHAALQITMMQSLIAAGRYTEAAEVSEQMAGNNDNTNLPDSSYVLGLFNFWLRWRCLLPADAAISLCWPRDIPALESDAPGLPPAYDSGAAAEAGERFRRFCHDTMTGVSPPPRFFAGTLLAMIECAEKNFPEAMRLLDMAAEACKQMYDWRYDLEIRISRITLRLRWAQFAPEMAESLVNESIDMARDLCSMMAERGLALRVAQVAELFREEAHLIAGASHRDYGGQFERIGAAAQTAAHVVMRNSRSAEAGPIDRARLFVMGPLRLMRSHSYMEISESAFGREAARTLLIVLVAAAVLDRAPTREEIAACVALKARSPEQQKKALYNAASAARAACGSLNSILNIGANNLELNINPDLEGSVWVDALEILRAVRHGGELDRAGEHGAAFDEYQRALMLARKGEFASDIYAEWIEAARMKLSDAVRRAALSVARIALRTGLYQAGIEAINAQLTRDQFDEEAHRALIRLFKESGNRIAALKQLEKCRKLIKREFGVEPERETLRLRQELIAEEIS